MFGSAIGSVMRLPARRFRAPTAASSDDLGLWCAMPMCAGRHIHAVSHARLALKHGDWPTNYNRNFVGRWLNSARMPSSDVAVGTLGGQVPGRGLSTST